MDTIQYWPIAREYTLWNATVSALQFWMEDLERNTLSATIERVYMVYFCSESSQQLHTSPDEILFGHFVTTLNDLFECELAQEDEDMNVEVTAQIFLLLYTKHHDCIMLQHKKIYPSDQPHLEHAHLLVP